MSLNDFLLHSDLVSRLLALVLLVLSIGSWVVMVWKAWLLQRAGGDVARSTAAFWQSASLDKAREKIAHFLDYVFKDRFRIIDQIHFIDRNDHMFNLE